MASPGSQGTRTKLYLAELDSNNSWIKTDHSNAVNNGSSFLGIASAYNNKNELYLAADMLNEFSLHKLNPTTNELEEFYTSTSAWDWDLSNSSLLIDGNNKLHVVGDKNTNFTNKLFYLTGDEIAGMNLKIIDLSSVCSSRFLYSATSSLKASFNPNGQLFGLYGCVQNNLVKYLYFDFSGLNPTYSEILSLTKESWDVGVPTQPVITQDGTIYFATISIGDSGTTFIKVYKKSPSDSSAQEIKSISGNVSDTNTAYNRFYSVQIERDLAGYLHLVYSTVSGAFFSNRSIKIFHLIYAGSNWSNDDLVSESLQYWWSDNILNLYNIKSIDILGIPRNTFWSNE